MYKKIMVPMDGSNLAESVLPHVESVVRGCSAPEVVFIRVVEPVHLPVGTITDGGAAYTSRDAARDREISDAHNREVAADYLKKLISQVKFGIATVSSVVLQGEESVAEELAGYAKNNDIDLVIISTHGRSGMSRLVWGSTADNLLRNVCTPVLMVRAPGCGPDVYAG